MSDPTRLVAMQAPIEPNKARRLHCTSSMDSMITLYDYELSGNCYKIRLMLSLLNQDYRKHSVEFYPAAEHRGEAFLAINPMGELPALRVHNLGPSGIQAGEATNGEDSNEDHSEEDFVLRDSNAILTYLAKQFDASDLWLAGDQPERLAKMQQWLSFANEITATASLARLADGFFYDVNDEAARKGAHRLFRILDEHIWFQEQQEHDWLVPGAHPTIADIACFPYVMLSEEGGISRVDYPAIRRWCDRVKRLSGFIVMPGIFPAGSARAETNSESVVMT